VVGLTEIRRSWTGFKRMGMDAESERVQQRSNVNPYISLQTPRCYRELTCHMGSHSVTCHPAEVTFPSWVISLLRCCTLSLGYLDSNIAFKDMCAEADEQLFDKLIKNTNHVLHRLLPPATTASQHCNIRSRRHTQQLPEHHTSLSDSNFLIRMLYKDCY